VRDDAVDLLPRFGDDARWLEQHGCLAQLLRHCHREALAQREAFAGESVRALDAALGKLAVLAHIPLASRAAQAWRGIRPPDDSDHELSRLEARACGSFQHLTERFMAEHEAAISGRWAAVTTIDDLVIGSAQADR
jgi:hypothetical protein